MGDDTIDSRVTCKNRCKLAVSVLIDPGARALLNYPDLWVSGEGLPKPSGPVSCRTRRKNASYLHEVPLARHYLCEELPDSSAKVPIVRENCGSVKLWDVKTGKVVKTFDTRGWTTFRVAVSRDGRLLAAGGFRKEKGKTTYAGFVWDAKTGELKQTLPWREHPMWISSFAFSPDGRFLAVSGQTDGDGRVKDGEKTKGILKIIPLAR